jgi:hypothetical protein
VVANERKRAAVAAANEASTTGPSATGGVTTSVVTSTSVSVVTVSSPAVVKEPPRGLLPGLLASMSMGVIGGPAHVSNDNKATPISSPLTGAPLSRTMSTANISSNGSGAAAGNATEAVDVLPTPSQIVSTAWDVRITRAITQFDPKPYVSYEMHVRNGHFQWRIAKRYNRFVELHARVCSIITSIYISRYLSRIHEILCGMI